MVNRSFYGQELAIVCAIVELRFAQLSREEGERSETLSHLLFQLGPEGNVGRVYGEVRLGSRRGVM